MQEILVKGGECFATAEPNVIFKTILGPCVSACLFDPVLKIGGMNHFLLPGGGTPEREGRDRFGDAAMQSLLEDMLYLGANRFRLRAFLFGGCQSQFAGHDIGHANAIFARDFLRSNGIRLVQDSIGDNVARWVRFNPTTGHASIRATGHAIPVAANDREVCEPRTGFAL